MGRGWKRCDGDCRVGPDREECCRSEVHVTAIAAKNVPRRCQHDILQNHITGEEVIVVAECERGGEYDAGDGEANSKNRSERTVSVPADRLAVPPG